MPSVKARFNRDTIDMTHMMSPVTLEKMSQLLNIHQCAEFSCIYTRAGIRHEYQPTVYNCLVYQPDKGFASLPAFSPTDRIFYHRYSNSVPVDEVPPDRTHWQSKLVLVSSQDHELHGSGSDLVIVDAQWHHPRHQRWQANTDLIFCCFAAQRVSMSLNISR